MVVRPRAEKTTLSLESFERPSILVRLEIQKVLDRFRSGIHRSLVGGAGSEFKSFRPYDPSDPLRVIDTTVAARFSEHPDIEPMSRTYYAEKEITTVFVLDCGDSMNIPPRKMEHAARLCWLFALSTFRYGDRFRFIPFCGQAVYDSFWISNEDMLEQFCKEMRDPAVPLPSVPGVNSAFSYLVQLSLRDAVLIVVSDFCGQWDRHIAALRLLGMHENNMWPVCIALDEWHGFTPHEYGITLRDPVTARTAVLDMRNRGDVAHYADQARRHLLRINESVQPLGIPMIITPLITDPMATVFKTFVRMGWV